MEQNIPEKRTGWREELLAKICLFFLTRFSIYIFAKNLVFKNPVPVVWAKSRPLFFLETTLKEITRNGPGGGGDDWLWIVFGENGGNPKSKLKRWES